MITRRWHGRRDVAGAGGAALLAALLVVAGNGGAAVAKSFDLSITGAEGARYTGRCTLTTAAGGEETIELSGVVPRHEQLEGEGLACRIESDGPLTVEVTSDGSRSRSVTSGGVVNINVR